MAAGEPHFVIIPLLAQGHIIPACDMARLLATHGAIVTVIVTPANLTRLQSFSALISTSNLPIRLASLPFPSTAASIPDSCQNVDLVHSPDLFFNFFLAMSLLQTPLLEYLHGQHPPPTCIISDHFQPWGMNVARELSIPYLIFHGYSSFTLTAMHTIKNHKIYQSLTDVHKPFIIPGLPQPIETTKAKAPPFFYEGTPGFEKLAQETIMAEDTCDGIVLNTCSEMESYFTQQLEELTGKKVYAIGPLPLANKDAASKAARGNKPSIDESQCLQWLDSMPESSVVYLSFGSITHTVAAQLIEIGAGLEASGLRFIWVIKESELMAAPEVAKWLTEEEGFEKRVEGRGMVIKGWAPQAAILGHPAVGGFVTHCGWNSVMESVSAGLAMLTWPHFADQFLNEKVVVEVLKVGVPVGIGKPIMYAFGEEMVVVGREVVEKGVKCLMECGGEGEERRKRVRELGHMVRKAVDKGGSSFENLIKLIEVGSKKLMKPT
ncbi:UDP-glucuronosyl/UDP-glucosyltransferase protein [Dioscorea alata]|uniref:UDP-glucuronosyl/UDP-glucosyltransferase protein n=1 Tax=Dioscorea alata TaxID=55571 RepID=A0ACB7VJX1_DIOAL|nr:UDP-glucuronosyl/UDP-glucosyltransferase protein [Dioscorea alata]